MAAEEEFLEGVVVVVTGSVGHFQVRKCPTEDWREEVVVVVVVVVVGWDIAHERAKRVMLYGFLMPALCSKSIPAFSSNLDTHASSFPPTSPSPLGGPT